MFVKRFKKNTQKNTVIQGYGGKINLAHFVD